MSTDEQLRAMFHELTPFDLPIGVYLVARDGRFLECDERVRRILRLPPSGPVDASIATFYRDPEHRGRLLAAVDGGTADCGSGEGQFIPFRVQGADVYVRDFCRALRDPATGDVLGYVGCLVDVTDDERAQRLFDRLPAGVYLLDADDHVQRVNEAFARLFRFGSPDDMVGMPVESLYADPDRARVFHDDVRREGKVVNRVEELVRHDGERFFGSVNSFQITNHDGSYGGRVGVLADVTREERFRRVLESVPVGLYEVHRREGEDIIDQCNESFAHMFDYDSAEDVKGTPMAELYAHPEDYERFHEVIAQRDAMNLPVMGFKLQVTSRTGRQFVIEVNSRLLRDRSGTIVGRTGVVRDVTEEERLREQLDTVLADIGRVLHPLSPTLLLVHQTLRNLSAALGPSPLPMEVMPTTGEIDAVLEPFAARLVGTMDRLLATSEDLRVAAALDAAHWAELARLREILANYRERIPMEEYHLPTLRQTAHRVLEISYSIPQGVVSRDLLRQVRADGRALEQAACQVHVVQARGIILQMDHAVLALRDYVTTGTRHVEESHPCRVVNLVSHVVQQLFEFAQGQGVTVRHRLPAGNLVVTVSERDVERALTNLLHNAIKYTWSPDGLHDRWVDIRAEVVDGCLAISVTNLGVPIARDEIEQELVFQVGYRGAHSRDRGRLGTGIGLADARAVAIAHGGTVTIESRPATPGAAEDDYSGPFMTVATLILPCDEGGPA